MNEERWHKIKSIFEEAIELPETERKTYLDETCGDDNQLRSKVEELISADSDTQSLFDRAPDLVAKQGRPDPSALPESIGPYQIDSLLGQGGMGSVYKVYQNDQNHPLALKVVWANPLDASFTKRFKTEWAVLSKMRHPHIAQLYGEVMQEGQNTFFAMEFVDGVQITRYCKDKSLNLNSRLALFLDVCDAVNHAHSNQIIHRDIKPGNILVSSEGEVKLLDFGIAKVLDPELLDHTAHFTRTGARVLTPTYASPEQLKREELSTSSDIYSLGVLLYELLTERRPHDIQGKSPAEMERIVCTVPAPALGELISSVDPSQNRSDLETIVSKALRIDPNSRYESVDDFARDIERYLRNDKIRARPISKTTKAQSYVGRHKSQFALVLAAVFFSIIIGLIATRPDGNPRLKSGLAPDSAEEKILLALPFEHVGPEDLTYLSTGISSAVTENLLGLDGLKTISLTGSSETTKAVASVSETGTLFEADFVLHGKISYGEITEAGQKFRLSSELIRVRDSLVLWSNNLDETVSEVFDVEETISLQVAEALNLVLLETDQLDHARFMTSDLEAYKYYLRGNEFFRNPESEKNLELAELMYQQALEKDESFSKAHAQLSLVHSRYNFYRFDNSRERCEAAEASARQALVQNPNDEQSYLALAMDAYHCDYNFPEALKYFDQALRINPDFGEAIQSKAYALRRQGNLTEALEYFTRMEEVDPLRTDYGAITLTNILVGDYQAAERALNISIKYFPEEALINAIGAMLYRAWTGSADEARRFLTRNGDVYSGNDWGEILHFNLEMFDRNYERALSRLSKRGDIPYDTQTYYAPISQLKARALKALGRNEEARLQNELARAHLEQFVRNHPGDDRGFIGLGLVYAALGLEEKAIEFGLKGIDLANNDLVQKPLRHEDMAYIYVQLGRDEEAIKQLAALLALPNILSKKLIDNDPRWESLRDKPGYSSLGAG